MADLAECCLDGWILQNDEGTMLDLIARGETLFGWSLDELKNGPAPVMVHPDDRQISVGARNRVRLGADAQTVHVRVRARNHRWIWVEVEFHPALTVEGRAGLLTTATLRDVSDRYLGHEAITLLIEIRELIHGATGIAEAWELGLSRVGRLSSFDEAHVWERVDGELAPTHHWTASGRAQTPLCTNCRGGQAHDLAHTWATGVPRWSTSTCECESDRSIDRCGLLVPVLARGEVVALVEFHRRDGEPEFESETQLIAEVVAQVGDAVQKKQSESELDVARKRFELAFAEAAIGMAVADVGGTFIQVNEALCRLLDRSSDELVGANFRSVTHPDDADSDGAGLRDLIEGRRSTYVTEKRYIRPDGTVVHGRTDVALVREGGVPAHFVTQVQDITRRIRAETERERSTALFRAAFDESALAMALVVPSGETSWEIVEANDELDRIAEVDDAVGLSLLDVLDLGSTDDFTGALSALSPDADPLRAELPIGRQRSTKWVRVVASPVRQRGLSVERVVVVQMEDVTEERRVQDELNHLAMHDALTGLPNRVLMLDRLRRAQERSERSGRFVAVFFVDLDNFKEINDTSGHSTGDRLLELVADRFRHVLRPNDTAARFGGDEFVVICEDFNRDAAAAQSEVTTIANRLHEQLDEPFTVDGEIYWITASIGTHLTCGLAEPVQSILSNADAAMYQAKAMGRSRTELYDAAMRSRTTERLEIAKELRSAAELDQLGIALQPIVDLASERVVGAEALLRWSHPTLGDVSPASFIPIAEQSGLIVELGNFVGHEICGHLSQRPPSADYISINVSARQLSQADFVKGLLGCMEDEGIPPQRLAIELTESVLMEASGSARRQLGELRDAGLRVGIDDFGTGYASLRYVKDLPVTFLKIDRSFVAGIESDRDDRMIAEAVIGLAEALDLDVIAEGVETAGQAELLRELGCPHAQGYFFGRPALIDG